RTGASSVAVKARLTRARDAPSLARTEQARPMSDRDPATLNATELLHLYRHRRLSPVEATRACLDRIERWNDLVNAFCHVDADAALTAAAESEARWAAGTPVGLLDGVPVTIKDLVVT